MIDDLTWKSSEDKELKKAVISNLKNCEIYIEENQIEIAILQIYCDFEAKADNPQPLRGKMKNSQGFRDDLIESNFEDLKKEIEEINEEEIGEARASKSKIDAQKYVERRQKSFGDFRKKLETFIMPENEKLDYEKQNFIYLLAELKGKALLEHKEIIRYVLRKVLEMAKSSDDLFQASSYERFFLNMPNKRVLFGNYVDEYLKANQLPKAEVLIELSSERYEGSESEARIYFEYPDLENSDLGTLADIGKESRIINSNNHRMIRKMMEISKRGDVHLYAEKKSEEKDGKKNEYCLITKFVKGKDDKGLYIKFSGFMCWSIVREGKEEIIYSRGQYSLNQTDKKKEYLTKIDKLKEKIGEPIPKELMEWFEKSRLEKLIEILKDQKHGTSVIITDCISEVNRLCKMNYGTLMNSNDMCREGDEWHREQLLSVTSIDGALFIDLKGKCLALGVIVDGKVTKPGDRGKGARYNSITNYVEQKKKGIFLGIIVSEDGMIELTCNLKNGV